MKPHCGGASLQCVVFHILTYFSGTWCEVNADHTFLFIFQGLIVGNGYVEPSVLTKLTQPFASFGLLVPEQLQMIEPLVDSFTKNIALNRSSRAREASETSY